MTERPKLPTRVARAEHGENLFFGRRVNAELLGAESMASIAGLAVGGPAGRVCAVPGGLFAQVATVAGGPGADAADVSAAVARRAARLDILDAIATE